MSGHTPGPLHSYDMFTELSKTNYGPDEDSEWIDIKTKEGVTIGSAYMLSREENQANALLWSAAPELLEALLDARAQLEAYEEELSGECFNDTRINRAIAKATGKDND